MDFLLLVADVNASDVVRQQMDLGPDDALVLEQPNDELHLG